MKLASSTCSGLRASSPPRQVSKAEASFAPRGDPAVQARSTCDVMCGAINKKARPDEREKSNIDPFYFLLSDENDEDEDDEDQGEDVNDDDEESQS